MFRINEMVQVQVSDPWDFISVCGSGPFKGQIQDIKEREFLIRFEKNIVYGGKAISAWVALPRYQETKSGMDAQKRRLVINLIPVVDENVSNSMGTSNLFQKARQWRAWHLIGELSVA